MKIGLVDSGIGVVPFIKSIIKQNKKNDYYIYIDNDYFPYGNKNELELLDRLKNIIKYFEKYQIEELLVCCNTLSYIYMKYNLNSSFKIKTILEINIAKKKELLTTSFLSRKIDSIDGSFLATYIEKNALVNIIKLIKKLDKNDIILSCTHYPLIKSMFSQYNYEVYSYEDELIKELKDDEEMNFYISKNNYSLISRFFTKLCINFLYD